MNERERAANNDLQILGDAYRLGQIPRDEYRARRRHVFAGLRGDSVSNASRSPDLDGLPEAARRSSAALSSRNEAKAGMSLPVAAAQAPGTPWSGIRKYGWLLAIIILLILAAPLLAMR
ncbi:MAG: hypothetical protein NTZ11_10295 [Gammaproteobacteria bacterium]|nr:hypothetical protein [Gammaproteobacteria bacterium]